MTLNISRQAIVDAGADITICQTSSSVSLPTATGIYTTSLLWSTSGTGTFVDATILNPTYLPSATDILAGSVTLTLTATSAAPCATVSDAMTLNITRQAEAYAGPNDLICETQTTYTLAGATAQYYTSLGWTTSGTGNFSNPNNLNPDYQPSAADIAAGSVTLTLTAYGIVPCADSSSSLVLNISRQAVINAGNDTTICQTTTSVTLPTPTAIYATSLLWSSSGTGSFVNATILNPTYLPSAADILAGSVTLTLTATSAAPCATVSDNMTLNITRQAEANAGTNDLICETQTTYTLAGATAQYYVSLGWTTSGTGTFSNPNILNPDYQPSAADIAAGSVTLTLTAYGIVPCADSSSSLVLNISRQAVVDAGPDGIMCETELSYTIASASAIYYTTITWSTSGDGTFDNTATTSPIYTPGPNDIAAGSVMLTLTGTSAAPCITVSDNMILIIGHTVIASAGPDIESCLGSSVTVTGATAQYYSTLQWTHNGLGTLLDDNTLTPIYVPAPGELGVITLTLTATSILPCTEIIVDAMTITIYPLPGGSISGNGLICEGDSIPLHFHLFGTAPFTLTFTNGITSTTLTNIMTTDFDYYVTPPAGTNNYTIISLNDAHCPAPPANLTGIAVIGVHPAPVIDFTTNTACAEDSTYFSLSGGYIMATSYFLWNFGDGTWWSCNSPGCGSEPHVFPAPGTYQVTLFVRDTNGCTYTVSHPVVVRPHPVAFFNFTTPDCLNTPIYFTDLCTNPAGEGYLQRWDWDFGDGSPVQTFIFPASPNTSHVYAVPGNYPVTLRVTNSVGCRNSITLVVTVTETPIAGFNYEAACQNGETRFYNTSSNNNGGDVVSLHWDFGDPTSGTYNYSTEENPVHTYANPGYYTVSLVAVNFNGCSDTAVKQIYINPAPVAEFGSSPGCVGLSTYFWADTTVIDINAIATYSWNFGDGSTGLGRNIQHTYASAGSYHVELTITDTAGCAGTVTHIINVTRPPVALFYANANNCAGQAVSFIDLSYCPAGYITQWIWNFGDGATQTFSFPNSPNTTHTYAQAGSYLVTLTVTNNNGCSNTFSRIVKAADTPLADFIYSGNCQSAPVHFTDITQTSGSQSVIGWLWNFGDPASGIYNVSLQQNPTHTYATAGNYTVRMVIFTNSGCSDTAYKTITITPSPFVDFTAQSTCEDNPVQFVPGSEMNLNAIASWNWQFGDGASSILASPSHTYASPGTYMVMLTVTDTSGCSNSISHPVTVAPAPLVNFGYTNPLCSLSAVEFTDLTQVAPGYIVKWTWNFGDGSSQTVLFPNQPEVTHAYAASGNYNVTLTVKTSDSCQASFSRIITVNSQPAAAFTADAGCAGMPTQFNDISTAAGSFIESRLWNFGDPGSGNANTSSLQNPTHIYNNAGTYNVSLIVTNGFGCSDTVVQVITINTAPVIDFSITAGCSGDTTQFNSSAYVNMATTQSWLWQFGDGYTSTLPDPAHIYAQSGTFTVTLTITDVSGCTATRTQPVTITPAPIAGFSVSVPGCSNSAVTFNDLSNGNGGTISTWHWTFGDGHDTTYTSFTPAITHTYSQASAFSVTLTVYTQNGCENTRQQNIMISPSPVAGFAYQNTCEGMATQFNDQSVAGGGLTIVAWNWNFGDPASGVANTSALKDPAHTFTAPGTFQVTLVATNAAGCSDSAQLTVTISLKPGVDFYTGTIMCEGSPVEFYTDTTVTGIATVQSYDWDFGDGTAHSTLQNPVHTYTIQGTYPVTLTIVDVSGCQNSVSHSVTITLGPVSAFTTEQSCAGTATQFTDLSSAPSGSTIVSWHWDFGVTGATDDTSNMQNPVYTYSQPGLYTVSLTTTTQNGCSNTVMQPVQIWNTPTAAFAYNTTPCSNGTVQFMDQSAAFQATVTGWLWEFEPYQYSTLQHPSYTYFKTDTCYAVKLIITDSRGCTDTVIQQVCVPAAFAVDFTQQNTCAGSAVQFTSHLISPADDEINSYLWNFGDPASGTANTSAAQNPGHIFQQAGYYTVTLTANDIYGCTDTYIQTVQITGLPQASFTWQEGECDSTITFTSTSLGIAPIASYTWSFGDGTTQTLTAPANTVKHKYLQGGEYTVTLTVTDENGCSHSAVQTAELTSCLVAAMMIPDTLLCQNYVITFTDRSSGGAGITGWSWNWGDGTAPAQYNVYTPSVTHVYTAPGTYWVSLKITATVNGSVVSDSTATKITVYSTPLAGFVTDNVCLGDKTAFTDTTNVNGALWVSYAWNFGDPYSTNDISEDRNPTYTYGNVGEFDASLIVTNQFGCTDTASNPVAIHGLPDAAYEYSLACQGKPTYFFDHSEPFISPLTHRGWVISEDKQIGWMEGTTPSFTFDEIGDYNVLLTVADTNGCIDTVSHHVTVYPTPVSAFGIEKDFDNVQGQARFINGSLNADKYYWDFGNGETSSAESPVVHYDLDGDYLVQLYAYNQYECVDSTSMLYRLMYTGLWAPNAFAPSGPIEATRLWKPVGINLSYYRAEVYDRWDALIWSSEKLDEKGSPVEGWDGTYHQVPCQQGIYVWKITAIFRDGKIWRNNDTGDHTDMPRQTSGTITLIR